MVGWALGERMKWLDNEPAGGKAKRPALLAQWNVGRNPTSGSAFPTAFPCCIYNIEPNQSSSQGYNWSSRNSLTEPHRDLRNRQSIYL